MNTIKGLRWPDFLQFSADVDQPPKAGPVFSRLNKAPRVSKRLQADDEKRDAQVKSHAALMAAAGKLVG